MKMHLFSLFALLCLATLGYAAPTSIEDSIQSRALRDGIDLSILDEAPEALADIANIYQSNGIDYSQFYRKRGVKLVLRRGVGNIIDVHSHAIPAWYRVISPDSGGLQKGNGNGGGFPMPSWNLTAHLGFMNTIGISHSVLGFTGPSANAYLGDQPRTVALARLINEYLCALARSYPGRFSFLASIPLPYADDAVRELGYATGELGAVGVALTSNHEGRYLGDAGFTSFWSALDGMGGRQVVYVHPTTSYVVVNETFVSADPYPGLDQSRMEFYMETARTFIDLTITQTIHNFTNTHFILPHIGGAFPTMIDRVLKTVHSDLYDSSLEIYRTRFWWDSASPTYFHQIDGLLGYDIPKANLLYGTDYPFIGTAATQDDLQAIMDYPGLTDEEKDDLLSSNWKLLFGDKIQFQ